MTSTDKMELPNYSQGKYAIIAPSVLCSERKYNVSLYAENITESIAENLSEDYELKIAIEGPSFNESKSVAIADKNVQIVTFDIPQLDEGEYTINVEGLKGFVCKHSEKLNFKKPGFVIKLQTDKYAYKPGDIVNYRIIFLDDDLNPIKLQSAATVSLEDPKKNIVKKLTDLNVVRGVYTGQLEISEFAIVGNWRLHVEYNGVTDCVFFDVSKYVLPKYEVSVESTSNVAVQDGDMQVIVKANYTYDKPFNGKVFLVVKLETGYHRFMFDSDSQSEQAAQKAVPPTIIRTADMVNGKAKFDLNVREYEDYMPQKDYSYYLNITADVEERFTGVKLNASTSTTLYPYRYFFKCKNFNNYYQFKPDIESDVIIEFSHVDGRQVNDTKSVVKLIYAEVFRKGYFRSHSTDADKDNTEEDQSLGRDLRKLEFESHMNDKSEATFKVRLPALEEIKDYYHYYDVIAEYAGEQRSIFQCYQYKEPENIQQPRPTIPEKELRIRAEYEKDNYAFKVGQEAKFTITSKNPLSYFVYNVIGRGNILLSERVNLPDRPTSYELKFTTTFSMLQYGKIFLFYVDEEGKFHHAESTFSISPELRNHIDITTAEEAKPGDEVALNIKTEPNSFVGLLAIDQSVLLLGENNDFSEDRIRWHIGGNIGFYSPPMTGSRPGSWSGVITFTNAKYEIEKCDSGPALYRARNCAFGGVGAALCKSSAMAESSVYAAAPMGLNDSAPQKPVTIRKNFIETWIFDNIENTETEEFTWKKKIPDTITSWLISGFSLHPDKGLGVTKDRTKIITFQPFFISIRLPYSVKRGEVISVPALVFNYLEKDLDVEITLDNSEGEYEFTDVSNEVINEEKRSKTIKVPANSAVGASFILRPTVIGNIMLKFTAVSAVAGDAIHKTLKVIPEGVTEYANRAYFVNLKNASEFKETFELSLPDDIVPDSQHVEFGVVGDLLGPLLKNLDHLVRLPMGCGEQTVSKMVPNYFVLRYLQSINKLTPALESKIKRNVEVGYQHILTYRHDDGSFSSFGPVTLKDEKPRNGSTWLSAYVLRTLQQIDGLVKVDAKILKDGLDYLATKQAENGSFVDDGDFYYATQRNHITLTANVLQAFLENKTMAENYQSQIDKGFKFILENLEKTEDLHAKAVAVYTLQKANHAPEEIKKAISALKDVAKSDADRMWWSHRKEISNLWWRWSFSNDVEITSYILMILLGTESEAVCIDNVLPIIRWLVAQRNNYGGFSSTQDTVVGLQALIKFAQKSEYEAATMKVDVLGVGGNEDQQTIQVNDDNALLLQTVELAPKTNKINFEAQGKGAALVQISYQYNVAEKEKKPSFSVETVVKEDTPAFKFEMEVCVDYVGEGEASNMAVLEISLPSGYTADVESFDGINAVDGVRLTETKNSDSVIVVYFESLHKNDVKCLPIQAYKSFAVALQKPSPVTLYDYYDTTKKTTEYYDIVSSLMDLEEFEH